MKLKKEITSLTPTWILIISLFVAVGCNKSQETSPVLKRIQMYKVTGQQDLNLESMGLNTVPPETWELKNTRVLLLGDNQLTTFPKAIGKLSQLEGVHLDNNPLTKLAKEIGERVARAYSINLLCFRHTDNKLFATRYYNKFHRCHSTDVSVTHSQDTLNFKFLLNFTLITFSLWAIRNLP